MSLTLFTFPNNYRAFKAQIAAAYNGVELEVNNEFKGVSPTGKVPALSTPQGTLFESNSIARYVARLRADTGLMGSSFFQSAQVDQWLDFCANELESRRAIWLYPIFQIIPFDGPSYGKNKNDLKNVLKVLDSHLLKNQFLVGNQVTLADIAVTATLVDLFKLVFTPSYIRGFPNLVRYFTLMINQPNVAKVIGQVEFAKKEKMAPKPKKDPKKPAAKKEKKQQQPQQKKAPKPKNPLDCLPASKMVMDACKKKFFLCKPFNKEWFDGEFFQNVFDTEGYSFYVGNYKYNDENTIMYQTNNLAKMWFQRLDQLRKYGWGRFLITGKDEETGPFETRTMWMFRGQDVPKEMMDVDDSEYHTFTKVDVSTDAGKALIRQYWTCEVDTDKVENLTVLSAGWFK